MIDTLAVDSSPSDTAVRRRTMVADRHAADVVGPSVVAAGGADGPVAERRQPVVAVERPHRSHGVVAVVLLDSSPYPVVVGSHRLVVVVHMLPLALQNMLAEHWLDDADHEYLRIDHNFAEGTTVAAACCIRFRHL